MTFVVDTGPLSHFAQAGKLPVLRRILADEQCVFPPQVGVELDRGPHRLENQSVLSAQWISEHRLEEDASALAISLKNLLGGSGDRNLGEAQCLALAHILPAVTYIDDGEGCVVADSIGIEYTTTLELLADAVDDGVIDAAEAAETVDALIATGYKLTFSSGSQFLAALGIEM